MCASLGTVHQSNTGTQIPGILAISEGDRPQSRPQLSLSSLMRKIERQMCEAIKENKDLKIANTQVITYTNSSDVYLHGNLIARIGETWI